MGLDHHSRFAVMAVLSVCFASAAWSANDEASTATGVVYLDANANGERDEFEPGIGGVSVSNGKEVVRSDSAGRYEIQLSPQEILFVSKPADYKVPVDQNNLPQFYYRHYPDGTPAVASWDWPVIEPTGPLPEQIDFPLLPRVPREDFSAMAFADPQTRNDEQLDMLRKDIVEPLFGNPHGADFGVVAGDVVHDTLSLYDRHNRLMRSIGIPIWNVPGNHDLNRRAPGRRYSTETYKSVFGPDTYSFNHGSVHVLMLNNVDYRGAGQRYVGRLTDDQIAWIANDLAFVDRGHLILIVTHIPLLTHAPDDSGERYLPSINTTNLGDLLEALDGFENIYAISGHDTSNSWKTEINHEHGWHGRPFIAHTLAEVRGGGWERGPRDERGVREATMADGNPNGYYILRFEGASVTPHFIPAGGQVSDRLRITVDPALSPSDQNDGSSMTLDRGVLSAETSIVANFFDGGERDRLWISLDGGEPVEMMYVERTDPYVVAQNERFADSQDAFASPAVSSHIWQRDLPSDLAPGLHIVTVTAEDEFGLDFKASLTFEIEAMPED